MWIDGERHERCDICKRADELFEGEHILETAGDLRLCPPCVTWMGACDDEEWREPYPQPMAEEASVAA